MKLQWIAMAAIGCFIAVTAPWAPARADCYESCQGSCKDISGHLNSACVDTCSRAYCSKSNNNSSAGHFGAIAFGLIDAAEGISWGKGNMAAANRAALATCRKYGNNCKIVANFSRACAALGVAKGAQHFTVATASTEKQARSDALNECKRNWGVCLVDMSACSP